MTDRTLHIYLAPPAGEGVVAPFREALADAVADVVRTRASSLVRVVCPPLADRTGPDAPPRLRASGVSGPFVLFDEALCWEGLPGGAARFRAWEYAWEEWARTLGAATSLRRRLSRLVTSGWSLHVVLEVPASISGNPAWRAPLELALAAVRALEGVPDTVEGFGVAVTVKEDRSPPARFLPATAAPGDGERSAFEALLAGTRLDKRGLVKVTGLLAEGNFRWAFLLLAEALGAPIGLAAASEGDALALADELDWSMRGGPLGPPSAGLPAPLEGRSTYLDLPSEVMRMPPSDPVFAAAGEGPRRHGWRRFREDPLDPDVVSFVERRCAADATPYGGYSAFPRGSAFPDLRSWSAALLHTWLRPWDSVAFSVVNVPTTICASVLLFHAATAALVRTRPLRGQERWFLEQVERGLTFALLGFIRSNVPEGLIQASVWLAAVRGLLWLETGEAAWRHKAADRVATACELLCRYDRPEAAGAVQQCWDTLQGLAGAVEAGSDQHGEPSGAKDPVARSLGGWLLWCLAHGRPPRGPSEDRRGSSDAWGGQERSRPTPAGVFADDRVSTTPEFTPRCLLLGDAVVWNKPLADAGLRRWARAGRTGSDRVASAPDALGELVLIDPSYTPSNEELRDWYAHGEVPAVVRAPGEPLRQWWEAIPRRTTEEDGPMVPGGVLRRAGTLERLSASAAGRVFLNAPGDPPYQRYRSITDVVLRSVGLELCVDSPEGCGHPHPPQADRVTRIGERMAEAGISIHDLCRHQGVGGSGFARMNMPLELGIALAASKGRVLVLVDAGAPLDATISDLAASSGFLIRAYRGRRRFIQALLDALYLWGFEPPEKTREAWLLEATGR